MLPKVDMWKPGQKVVVVPGRWGVVPDAQVAAVVVERLRADQPLTVLEQSQPIAPPVPPSTPLSKSDPRVTCEQARALGADFVVLTTGDIELLDNSTCLLSDGIVRNIALPLPLPIPLTIGDAAALAHGKLAAEPSKCLISIEIGAKWEITASAQVLATDTCVATGGTFAVQTHSKTQLPDGAELEREILAKTPDLFPRRTEVEQVAGGDAVVHGVRGMARGDVYEVRSEARSGDLAYVRDVDDERGVLEPYRPRDRVAAGDVLVRRGRPTWLDFVAHGVASQLTIDGNRELVAGAGGYFRGELGAFVIGLGVEYLRVLDADVRAMTATTSVLRGGLHGGLHRRVSNRLDLYALLDVGFSDVLGVSSEGDNRSPYIAGFGGARLGLGAWFVAVEAGGVYAGTARWDGHVPVTQRAPELRLAFGRNFWIDMGAAPTP